MSQIVKGFFGRDGHRDRDGHRERGDRHRDRGDRHRHHQQQHQQYSEESESLRDFDEQDFEPMEMTSEKRDRSNQVRASSAPASLSSVSIETAIDLSNHLLYFKDINCNKRSLLIFEVLLYQWHSHGWSKLDVLCCCRLTANSSTLLRTTLMKAT